MGKQKAAPPMRVEPSDFSTDKYRCVNVINIKGQMPGHYHGKRIL